MPTPAASTIEISATSARPHRRVLTLASMVLFGNVMRTAPAAELPLKMGTAT